MKNLKKSFVFIFIIFVLFNACSSAKNSAFQETKNSALNSQNLKETNPNLTSINLNKIPQKLADTPKDKPISVLLSSGLIACYAPEFKNGEGFIVLKPCSQAKQARYDVFGRVAWSFGTSWLCMSEPENLGGKTANLVLRSCVINDSKQSWDFKNNAFVSASGLQVQDLNGFLVLSPDKKAKNHALSGMNEWINTVATPVNLNLATFLAWDFATGSGTFDTYYLKNDESVKNTPITLIYNPLSGQISQFSKSNGSHACLTSNQSRSQEWNWVIWTHCDFIESRQTISTQSWDLDLFGVNGKSFVRDYLGNQLRLTQYGVEWGVPYTATAAYAARDRANAPISLFRFDRSLQDFVRFYNGNLGDSLPQCPATGKRELKKALTAQNLNLMAENSNFQALLYLPADFQLTDAWKKRLWQIASSTDGVAQRAGDCGVCMLQSYQIIAELNENTQNPLQSGGYFFDTQVGTNPFPSFRNRYPLLASELENYTTRNLPAGLSQQEAFEQTAQMYRAMAITMYPQRNYRSEHFANALTQIHSMLDSFITSSVGSMWILNIYATDRSGRQSGHAMPVLRTSDGLVFIPTNTLSATYEQYASALQRGTAHTIDDALAIITSRYTRNVYLLFSLRIEEPYSNPLNDIVSSNNCTGEGEHRHGSGTALSLRLINQCSGGRCLIQ